MRALIDTNILIHRETKNPSIPEIGTLFYWLIKLGYIVCVHPLTKAEICSNKDKDAVKSFLIKMSTYESLRIPKGLNPDVEKVCKGIDVNTNDSIDTKLLDEVYSERVDILITEDKKIIHKAKLLKIDDKVFSIQSFLSFVKNTFPGLVDYDVLPIHKKFFSDVDLNDPFFDSFKNDYPEFEKWFSKKLGEEAYTLIGSDGLLQAFLYLKIENIRENYFDINPIFEPKKRLKIGTFKVSKVGERIGERFLKIIFDNAKINNVDEIYVTIFNNSEEKKRLIKMLENWGFYRYGTKKTGELVYSRKYTKKDNTPVDRSNPKKTYPYISQNASFYMISIKPEFHTDLFPDSILRGEDPSVLNDSVPHRNAISKCYISTSPTKDLKSGDAIVFYRTGGKYKGVATTIGLVENIILDIKNAEELIKLTKKRTVLTEEDLRNYYQKSLKWGNNYKMFVINFLYVGTLKKRPNLKSMREKYIIDKAPISIDKISKESFKSLYLNNL